MLTFGHCPNHVTPPPHPNLGNSVLFFRTSKTRFCAYDRKRILMMFKMVAMIIMMIMMVILMIIMTK